jgi:hypothetical protein
MPMMKNKIVSTKTVDDKSLLSIKEFEILFKSASFAQYKSSAMVSLFSPYLLYLGLTEAWVSADDLPGIVDEYIKQNKNDPANYPLGLLFYTVSLLNKTDKIMAFRALAVIQAKTSLKEEDMYGFDIFSFYVNKAQRFVETESMLVKDMIRSEKYSLLLLLFVSRSINEINSILGRLGKSERAKIQEILQIRVKELFSEITMLIDIKGAKEVFFENGINLNVVYHEEPRKVSLIGDSNREEYLRVGSDVKVLSETAAVLFCSGKGSRLVTGDWTKPTVPLPIASRKTPLELLIRSLPLDIGQIVISILPDDVITKDYLENNKFFGHSKDKFSYVLQDMVSTAGTNMPSYPGGTGYVFERVMTNDILGSAIKNVIFIDGEKMGVDVDVLKEFLGSHVANTRMLSVATYPLMDDPDGKYAHVDTFLDRAFSGKTTPKEVRDSRNKEAHHLGAGVYIASKGIDFLPLSSEKEIKAGATFYEKPIIGVVNAVGQKYTPHGIGYFQVKRGELGLGNKDRDAVQKNSAQITGVNKQLLSSGGWNVGQNVTIEIYEQKDESISPNSTLSDGSSIFLSGPSSLGQNNLFQGDCVVCTIK